MAFIPGITMDRKANPGEPEGFLRMLVGHEGDACVLWPFRSISAVGYKWTRGYYYGFLRFGGGGRRGKKTSANRAMCLLAYGEPPDPTMEAAHNCGNSLCVNPRHLRWATPAENVRDKLRHGTAQIGEKNPVAKLTVEAAAEIRRRALLGERQADIARDFGISRWTVSDIKKGKTWTKKDN